MVYNRRRGTDGVNAFRFSFIAGGMIRGMGTQIHSLKKDCPTPWPPGSDVLEELTGGRHFTATAMSAIPAAWHSPMTSMILP